MSLLLPGLRRALIFGLGRSGGATLAADLVEALHARWLAWAGDSPDPDVAALAASDGKGVWIAEAPPDAGLPVAVIDEVSRTLAAELIERRGDRTRVYDGRLQLRVHDATRPAARKAALAIADDWESAAANNRIAFAEGRLIDLSRSGPLFSPADPDPGPDGDPVWSALIEFQFTLVETITAEV
ncbi:MAG: hypothetical protein U0790_00175 [Isosphaeraceae bacterium]